MTILPLEWYIRNIPRVAGALTNIHGMDTRDPDSGQQFVNHKKCSPVKKRAFKVKVECTCGEMLWSILWPQNW